MFVAPDRPAQATNQQATTNHPDTVEWPEHARWVRSVERLKMLQQLGSAEGGRHRRSRQCSSRRLIARQWDAGFATLFTAVYRPVSGRLDYHWPGHQVALALERPVPDAYSVTLE